MLICEWANTHTHTHTFSVAQSTLEIQAQRPCKNRVQVQVLWRVGILLKCVIGHRVWPNANRPSVGSPAGPVCSESCLSVQHTLFWMWARAPWSQILQRSMRPCVLWVLQLAIGERGGDRGPGQDKVREPGFWGLASFSLKCSAWWGGVVWDVVFRASP